MQGLELGHLVPFPDLISLFCINEPAMEVAFYIL